MLEPKEINQSCITINKLFQEPNFFNKLCSISNNNIEEVINNIYLIINYYLSTQDIIYKYNIQELLTKAQSIPKVEDIIIHPSNSHYERKYKLLGLNSTSILTDTETIELEILEQQVSYSTQSTISYCAQITPDIKEAITLSHTSPTIVYKSILKQPNQKELPIVTGTKETNYYQSILEIRLKNVDELYRKTVTKKAKRILKRYIGKDSLLVLFPKCTKRYYISNKDISNQETSEYIPSRYLSFITIPSRYKLLSICNENKRIRNGELIDIKTGEEYQTTTIVEEPTYHVYYSRFETLPITQEFIYSNNEFTGDISYDLDLIYGHLDTNHSRERTPKDPYRNIDFIKTKDDIHVRLINGKYHIRNGRHRLLFLKNFYVTNYHSYKETDSLDKLRELVTINIGIERTIESPSINNLLSKIKELNPKINIFKTNINNEEPELLIIYDDYVYITSTEEELNILYKYLSNEEYINPYYIGTNNTKPNINYQDLYDYLILTLKEKLFDMSLTDIIKYLIKEGFYQHDQYFLISDFNYYYLYFEYTDLQHYIQLKKLFKKPITIIEDTKEKLEKQFIGEKIISIIKQHPDLIDLDWKDLYQIISSIEEFSNYSSEFLESAANYVGYQKYKLLRFYKDEKNAKSLLI